MFRSENYDCGYTDLDTLRITVAEENYDLYIIEGEYFE